MTKAASTSIPTGGNLASSVPRTNFTNLDTAVNELKLAEASATSGEELDQTPINLVYRKNSDGKWYKAIATGIATLAQGFTITTTSGADESIDVYAFDEFGHATFSFTHGADNFIYLSPSTAGASTQTAPTAAGQFRQAVGWPINATTARWFPDKTHSIVKMLGLEADTIDSLVGNTLDLSAITSTVAELNILDGVTSTAAELNILDGVTSTAAELNILDGVTTLPTLTVGRWESVDAGDALMETGALPATPVMAFVFMVVNDSDPGMSIGVVTGTGSAAKSVGFAHGAGYDLDTTASANSAGGFDSVGGSGGAMKTSWDVEDLDCTVFSKGGGVTFSWSGSASSDVAAIIVVIMWE